MDDISNLNNWINVSGTIFRFIRSKWESYEIMINCYYSDTPIETANATLYKIKYVENMDNKYMIERILIRESLPICELLTILKKYHRR